MNYRIALLYWGNDGKYEPLLCEWLVWYEMADLADNVVIVTDEVTRLPNFALHYDNVAVHVPSFGPIDHDYVFDRKGAITCQLITDKAFANESLLVVDADAFIRKDPTPLLEPFKDVPFAMPDDFGALDARLRLRTGYQSPIPKRCAGVMWFGESTPNERKELVDLYRASFAQLLTGAYQESRHLFEQHAWATVAYAIDAPCLPRTLNWPDHIRRFGPNEDAAIYHRIGRRKWRKK